MGYQAVFKRYEIKYMITKAQKESIMRAMEPYMELDRFGRSTIRNIYFDTDDYILARHSIAKPAFKEKLRIRSYSKAEADSTVFVELKRKFDHVVYKRRLGMPETDAMKWMAGAVSDKIREEAAKESPQVAAEIGCFLETYKGIRPAVYLSYDREAYRMKPGATAADGGADFRVTFDENILARDYDLSLESEAYGKSLLEEGRVLMELKCSGGIPLWMVSILSELKLYKTSFSKYGTAYQTMVFPALADEAARRYAAASANAQKESARTSAGAATSAYSNHNGGCGKHDSGRRRHRLFGFGQRHATA